MTLPQPVYNEIKEYVLTAYDTTLMMPEGAQVLPDAVWRTPPNRPILFAKIDNTRPATTPRRFLSVRATTAPDPIPQEGTYIGRCFSTLPLATSSIIVHIFEVDPVTVAAK